MIGRYRFLVQFFAWCVSDCRCAAVWRTVCVRFAHKFFNIALGDRDPPGDRNAFAFFDNFSRGASTLAVSFINSSYDGKAITAEAPNPKFQAPRKLQCPSFKRWPSLALLPSLKFICFNVYDLKFGFSLGFGDW